MRTGVDKNTGKVLKGWAHCVQSIETILTTRVGTLMWRRAFGADVQTIQDQNATSLTLITLYRSVAEALDKHEPAFVLENIELERGGRDGVFIFILTGTFYPNGHIGIFDEGEVQTATINPANDNNLTPGRVIEVAA